MVGMIWFFNIWCVDMGLILSWCSIEMIFFVILGLFVRLILEVLVEWKRVGCIVWSFVYSNGK